MKTLEQVKKEYFSTTHPIAIDGRDLVRLAVFIPKDQLKDFGIELRNPDQHLEPIPFTRENILEQLEKDLKVGFEQVLDRREIGASLMFECVKMWNWILQEGLENCDDYGLPLLKATALKYGFNIPSFSDT